MSAAEVFDLDQIRQQRLALEAKMLPKPNRKSIDGDWLTPMTEGTIFLVFPTHQPMARLIEFTRSNQIPCGAIMLWTEQHELCYYDAGLFCKTFSLYGVVKEGKEDGVNPPRSGYSTSDDDAETEPER